jgi:methionyl aminopeptidase
MPPGRGSRPGSSTTSLAGIARHKVTSAFLHYNPGNKPAYPAVLCTSRNEVIVHGIPRKSDVLQDGDIIGIDFGIFKQGFCADTARTLMIGNVSPENRRLVETCRDALEAAIALCRPATGWRSRRNAVRALRNHGVSVVTKFVGHGTGRQMHEDPQVPNFGKPNDGKRMKSGLVIAVEPMVNAGAPDVEELEDDWTAVTRDRSMSAHFEHTIAILDEGPWVLTRPSSTTDIPDRPDAMSAHFEHTIAILDEGPWVLTRPTSTPGNPGRP